MQYETVTVQKWNTKHSNHVVSELDDWGLRMFFGLSHQLIDKLYRLDTEASEGLQDKGNELAILLCS